MVIYQLQVVLKYDNTISRDNCSLFLYLSRSCQQADQVEVFKT